MLFHLPVEDEVITRFVEWSDPHHGVVHSRRSFAAARWAGAIAASQRTARVPAENAEGGKKLARCMLRAQMSLEKMREYSVGGSTSYDVL